MTRTFIFNEWQTSYILMAIMLCPMKCTLKQEIIQKIMYEGGNTFQLAVKGVQNVEKAENTNSTVTVQEVRDFLKDIDTTVMITCYAAETDINKDYLAKMMRIIRDQLDELDNMLKNVANAQLKAESEKGVRK